MAQLVELVNPAEIPLEVRQHLIDALGLENQADQK